MSSYINTQTNEYPFFVGDIKLLYPDTEQIPEHFAAVVETPFPEVTSTQVFEEASPVLNESGEYERVYVVRELTDAELEAKKKIAEAYLATRVPDGPFVEAPAPEDQSTN